MLHLKRKTLLLSNRLRFVVAGLLLATAAFVAYVPQKAFSTSFANHRTQLTIKDSVANACHAGCPTQSQTPFSKNAPHNAFVLTLFRLAPPSSLFAARSAQIMLFGGCLLAFYFYAKTRNNTHALNCVWRN